MASYVSQWILSNAAVSSGNLRDHLAATVAAFLLNFDMAGVRLGNGSTAWIFVLHSWNTSLNFYTPC